MPTPQEIVEEKMLGNDAFSRWLGIRLLQVSEGGCSAELKVRKDMLNGFHIAHGGIAYALADSVFAFATNSIGQQAVSLETSISHTGKVILGDVLTAKTTKIHKSRKFAIYSVQVKNQEGALVATFKGTAYYTGQAW